MSLFQYRGPGTSLTRTRFFRTLLLVTLLAVVQGCATADSKDPLEPVNRAVFKFNDGLDRYALRPVAKGYDAITPSPLRSGLNNFFNNLIDFNTTINAFLQGRFGFGVDNGSRFLLNSTLGFFGFVDVASDMGIPRYMTDFGHTLAVWGVPQGPYVMLPLLGPSTVRAGVGTFVDGYGSPQFLFVDNDNVSWGVLALGIVDQRAALLGADQLTSGDRYVFFRDAYLQRRAAITGDGAVVDDFSEFDEGWEEDDL